MRCCGRAPGNGDRWRAPKSVALGRYTEKDTMPDINDGFMHMHSRMEESFARYRTAGFGLMATIISLSAGGIAGVLSRQPPPPQYLAVLLFFPILLALFQQYCAYMGQLRGAESSFEQLGVYLNLEMKGLKGVSGTKEDPGLLKKAFEANDASTWWYGWADKLCAASVTAFSIIALIVLIYLVK